MAHRHVVLIRHAKAEQQARSDLVRRLTPRGRRDARAVGRWLAAHSVAFDLVLVSPAARARETWDAAAVEIATDVPVDEEPRIYDNTVADVLAVLAEVDDVVRTVALVGHNPSFEALAARWGMTGEMPTASVAMFGFDGTWAEIDDAKPVLSAFATCRDKG
jgi:phosphohistidine phosphatase